MKSYLWLLMWQTCSGNHFGQWIISVMSQDSIDSNSTNQGSNQSRTRITSFEFIASGFGSVNHFWHKFDLILSPLVHQCLSQWIITGTNPIRFSHLQRIRVWVSESFLSYPRLHFLWLNRSVFESVNHADVIWSSLIQWTVMKKGLRSFTSVKVLILHYEYTPLQAKVLYSRADLSKSM